MKKILFTFGITLLAVQSQSIWNVPGDQTWSTSTNWSGGVPTSLSTVQFAVQPDGNAIGIDTGTTTVASISFNSTLTAPMDIAGFSPTDNLIVTGAITNNDTARHTFSLTVNAGGSATWTGPLAFNNIVNIGTNAITLATGTNTVFNGSRVYFTLNSTSSYGKFLGTGTSTFSGGEEIFIDPGSTYTGVLGDTFDLTTGSFSGALLRVSSLPTLNAGLTWNTSSFLSGGVLTVVSAVPEPQSWIMLIASSFLMLGFCIRRTRLSGSI